MKWRCKCLRGEEEEVRELDYQRCNLEEVPADVFNYERTLEILYLDSNHLTELPRQLFHCHGLMVLGISDNGIPYLPPAIASLIHLQSLDASKNSLEELPDNLKGCKCLSKVNLSSNQLEKLPEGFTQLLNLTEVYLNDTLLDFLPANLGRLSKLRILELRDNYLNTLPKSMARLVSLQRLDIGQNEFSEFPEELGNLPELRELWIDSNKIKCLPQAIGNLSKLELLDASNNRIDYIAPSIGRCHNLQDLLLNQNCIQELPPSFCKLQRLQLLKLDENQLAALPEDIGNASSLTEVLLSQNDLETFPSSIGLLRKLQVLIADENIIEDIPPELGSCVGLRILSVRSNRLMQIPGELGHLPELQVLNFTENHLNNLPCSFSKFNQLQALWLATNQNKPLVPLQLDEDPETGHSVLTCYLLPQQPFMGDGKPETSDTESFDQTAWEAERSRKSLVRFAPERPSEEVPGRLMRAPTPYPKELRALQRQVKEKQKKGPDEKTPASVRHEQYTPPSRKQRHSIASQEEDSSLEAGMVLPSQAPHQVREAKVTKPQQPASPQSNDTVETISSSAAPVDKGLRDNVTTEVRKPFSPSDSKTEDSKQLDTSKLLGNATAPLYKPFSASANRSTYLSSAQEAKSRYSLSIGGEGSQEAKCRLSVSPGKDEISASSGLKEDDGGFPKSKQQPPPYHVAAAYSKHAAHFARGGSPSGLESSGSPSVYPGIKTTSSVTSSSWTSSQTTSSPQVSSSTAPSYQKPTYITSNYPRAGGIASLGSVSTYKKPEPSTTVSTTVDEKSSVKEMSSVSSSSTSGTSVRLTETFSSTTKTKETTSTTILSGRIPDEEKIGVKVESAVNGLPQRDSGKISPTDSNQERDVKDGPKRVSREERAGSPEKMVNGVASGEHTPVTNSSRKSSIDIDKIDLKSDVGKVIEAIDQSMQNSGLVATIDTLRKDDSSDESELILLPNGTAEQQEYSNEPPPLAPKPSTKIPSPGFTSRTEEGEASTNASPSKAVHKISPPSSDSKIPKPGSVVTKHSNLPVMSGTPSPVKSSIPSKTSSGIPKPGSVSKLNGPSPSHIPTSGIPKPSSGIPTAKSSLPAPTSGKSGIPSLSGSSPSNTSHSQKSVSSSSIPSAASRKGIPVSSSTTARATSPGSSIPGSRSAIPSLTPTKSSTPTTIPAVHRKTPESGGGGYHKSIPDSAPLKSGNLSGLPTPSYRKSSRDSSPISRPRDHSPINTGTFKRNSTAESNGSSNRKFSDSSSSVHTKKTSDAYRKTSSSAFSKSSSGGGGMALDGHILGRNVAMSKPSRTEKPIIHHNIMDIDQHRANNNNNDSWNYGSHRNPKVFPVVIEKNPGLGFSISGGSGSPINPLKPTDEGIYVTRVHPSGPASTVLRAGDRLLKVDSVDFENMSHSDAVNVLTGTGNTVSITVSRARDAYSD